MFRIIEDLKAVIIKNKILKELENKIREALPRLKELTKGCIFTNKNKNKVINYEVLGFSPGGKLNATCFNKFKVSWDYNVDKFRVKFEVIGHPIKLNDVLQYLVYLGFPIGSYQYKQVLKLWYLPSVFLGEQSTELKGFLNRL